MDKMRARIVRYYYTVRVVYVRTDKTRGRAEGVCWRDIMRVIRIAGKQTKLIIKYRGLVHGGGKLFLIRL